MSATTTTTPMTNPTTNPGTVYLIHFKTPYTAQTGKKTHSVRHYLGWAKNLKSRIDRHRCGHGARLLQVADAAGIEWEVVQTWEGDRALERKLKNRKNTRCFCPVCRAESKGA